jgi:hypothetical protein
MRLLYDESAVLNAIGLNPQEHDLPITKYPKVTVGKVVAPCSASWRTLSRFWSGHIC